MKKFILLSLVLVLGLAGVIQSVYAESSTYVVGVSSTLADGNYLAGQIIPIVVTFNENVKVEAYQKSTDPEFSPQLILQLNNGSTSIAYFDSISKESKSQLIFNYTVGENDQTPLLSYASTTSLIHNSIDPSQVTITGETDKKAANLILAVPGSSNSLSANSKISLDAHPNPVVLDVSSTVADGSYKSGDLIPLTVFFSRPVTVSFYIWRSFDPSRQPKFSGQTSVSPTLSLAFNGGLTKAVTYSSGSGSAILNFDYTVSEGEATSRLDYSSTSSLAFDRTYLNLVNPETGVTIYEDATGAIQGLDNLPADLNLASPGTAGSLSVNKNIQLDGQAPVITLTGESLVVLSAGDAYTDVGASASDNLDGNLTSSIVTTNNLNSNRVGTYTFNYNVTDSAGNSATEKTRTIKVKNTLSNLPALSTMLTDASVTVSGSDLYRYQLDNQGISNVITSNHPLVLTDLSLGFHTLTVWGRNEGDLDWLDTPSTYAWVVTDDSGQAANVVSVVTSNSTISVSPDWGTGVILLSDSSLTNTKIDLSSMMTRGANSNVVTLTGTNLILKIQTIYGFLEVNLPTGLSISGPTTWDGIINLALLANSAITTPSETGFTNSVNIVLEIGSSDNSLSLDQAVRLVLPAQAGQKLIWGSASGNTQAISNVCASDDQSSANSNLGAGADCHLDSGLDAVIWTKHFSKFASYQQSAIVVAPVSSGGGSGGSFVISPADLKLLFASPLVLDSGSGKVLGLKVYNFTKALRKGMRGNDVSLLQFLLIKQDVGSKAKVLAGYGMTGYFGPVTQNALIEYQKYFKLSPANGILNYRTKLHFKNLSNGLKESFAQLSAPKK
ncbi:MAG: hypothetical protein COX02_00675 [Candidatus Vogelbacteria bacterium CG22_combo_CG10-13_8_21_14_all_37_9]|uniref:Pesticidal crystal protein Cry22Aa Ig-like domain-containing protein n=1 Tax=Candidatus Vogelbacteria bacterium CG22_combo_CG10-13_8_21_14_all_37_9 TaxID=1975046 RepID=A0A2H0BKZ8_9BACT|nr:MAG: hypothetical protein COX02_00675 [Candidatus Vogelbacteria bacterium CG22_combo_CG10-13_8_21_14_all_37_9]